MNAPKLITPIKKFAECAREIGDFYIACREGLKDKLGCVLFQLPPSFHYTPDRLELILHSVNPDFKNVIEFRHPSWWTQQVFEAFNKRELIFCSVNYPNLPASLVATTSTACVHLHGNPTLFYSEYSLAELDQIYEETRSVKNLNETFIYFNNTASTAGILNALAMQKKAAVT